MPLVAHCFVEREDWSEWLRINTDMSGEADYDNWALQLDKFRQEVVARGGQLENVTVRPAEFAAWCAANGKEADSNSRANYAATKLAERKKGGGT
jgi:predicted aminopeptidase